MKEKTAEQWIEEYAKKQETTPLAYEVNYDLMEKFAEYHTADIHASIMNFYLKLKGQTGNESLPIGEREILLNVVENYEAHFGITELRKRH